MKIDYEAPETLFSDLLYGDIFVIDACSPIYLKTPGILNSNEKIEYNAVNLALGTIARFDYDKPVWPVKGRLIVSGGGTLI